MTTTTTQRQQRRIQMRFVWLAVAVVAFLVPFVFEFDGLSPAGHRMFAIFLVAIVLWVAEPIPLYSTAALIIFLEILMISDQALVGLPADFEPRSFRDYYSALADPVLMLVLGGFFLAMGSSRFRLDRAMGRILLRPFGDRPANIMLGLMLITGTFSMFMSNVATTATMMAVVLPVVAALPTEDRLRVGMVLAIPFAANIGGIGTPVGTPPNAIAIGQLAGAGISISFGKWMVMALPGAIALIFISWWLIRRLFPSDTKTIDIEIEGEFDRSRKARIFYVVFIVTVLLWMTESFHGVTSSIVGFLPVVVLLITGVLNEKDLQSVQWHVLWLIAGGIALGRGIVDSGLDDWVIGLISWESLGATVTLGVFTVAALVLSTVMSNSASANLLIPLGVSLALSGTVDVDPLVVGFMIAIGASLAMALPISTPTNAVAYSSGLIKTADMAKTGMLIGIIGVIIYLFVSPLLWSAMGVA
ncbi:MAG: DASS family sodium-coupled anion symporter [Acidimicrobiia bacterium]|nr:DASS family sodium-coupled anion symporter [Acidimicrobiia bacterium]